MSSDPNLKQPAELTIQKHFGPETGMSHQLLPFEMPANVERFTLSYHYQHYSTSEIPLPEGILSARSRLNTIDLGLIGPDGEHIASTGSNKNEIVISETDATPGCHPTPLKPGTWQIIAGIYRVADEGVDVIYQLHFEYKHRRLLVGDLHTHTTTSDGNLTLRELAEHARAHRLDFVGITDHNHPTNIDSVQDVSGITLIPGIEWTQYHGHANFLGVEKPYDGTFAVQNEADVLRIFETARDRGALIVLNHPSDDSCPFTYDLSRLPFDVLEVWNGPMRPSNLRTIGLWQSMLVAGRKISAVGGSDYHKDRFAQMLAGPAQYVYAQSNSPADILAAVRNGHSYITFQPHSHILDMHCGEAQMGDSVSWRQGLAVEVQVDGLVKGDVLRVVSTNESIDWFTAPASGSFKGSFPVRSAGFVRFELWQSYQGLLPAMPVLLSNPIWFDS